MSQEETPKPALVFGKQDISGPFFVSIILTVAAIGIIFRSMGINNTLWLDEAMWAQQLVNNPLLLVGFKRPIGFLAITKVLIAIKNTDLTLRLIPYVSSIIAIGLTYLIAKEVFKSKLTIFLSVFLVSFNPILISFAKEFKPYSNEFCIHLLIILILLLYINNKVRLKSYHIFGILFLLFPFAYNTAFLYPSVFLLLMTTAYRKRNSKEFLFLTSLLCLGLATILVVYFLFLQDRISPVFWGRKYDVFLFSTDLIQRAEWTIRKYLGLIWSSGRAEVFWDFFSIKYEVSSRISFLTDTLEDRIVNVALFVLHAIGLIFLIFRKKINYILIFVLPIFTVIICNTMGIWPFGPFRVNLFLFSYFLLISLYGLDVITTTTSRRLNLCTSLFALSIFVALQLPIKPAHFALKIAGNPGIKPLLTTLFSPDHPRKGHPRIIMAEGYSYFPIKYYMESHSEFSEKYKKTFNNYQLVRLRKPRELTYLINILSSESLNEHEPVWIVNSYYRDFNKLDKYLLKENILLHKIHKKSELLLYLPHAVSNLFTTNRENGFADIKGLRGMELESQIRNGNEVMIARTTREDACFELPRISNPTNGFLSISAQIQSPAKTRFRIFYMTDGEKGHSVWKSLTIWIEYRNNTLSAIIPDKNIHGRVRICPGAVPGDYVISEIDISAVDTSNQDVSKVDSFTECD